MNDDKWKPKSFKLDESTPTALNHVKGFRAICDEGNAEIDALTEEYQKKRSQIVQRSNAMARPHLQAICEHCGLDKSALWSGLFYMDTQFVMEHDVAMVVERAPQDDDFTIPSGAATGSRSIN